MFGQKVEQHQHIWNLFDIPAAVPVVVLITPPVISDTFSKNKAINDWTFHPSGYSANGSCVCSRCLAAVYATYVEAKIGGKAENDM